MTSWKKWGAIVALLFTLPSTAISQTTNKSPVVLPHVQSGGASTGNTSLKPPPDVAIEEQQRQVASRTAFIVMSVTLLASTGLAIRPAGSDEGEQILSAVRPQMALGALMTGLTSAAAMSAGIDLGNGWVIGGSAAGYAAALIYPWVLRRQAIGGFTPLPEGCCVQCSGSQFACGDICIDSGKSCQLPAGCACN